MPTNYLREWRTHRKMTLDQVASACSSTKGAISRLETGDRRLTLGWMEKISAALGINPNDLLRPPAEYSRKKHSPPPGAVMLTEVSGITSESLRVVEVRGDGMSPTFTAGDRLIVDHDDRTLTNGVFLIDVGSGPEVKRLAPMAKAVRISTDNPAYAAYDVEARKLAIVGRVVARISKV